ncbi:hypothetical protein [Endozoicomonas acroporae]|uniref:hypothetical protein n=1 Tax=Endozoicomonas acroporae TaxID=1701104 RepID=UPI003D78F919
MIKWENKNLGEAGNYYPILYLLPLPLIVSSLILFGYSLYDGLQILERLVSIGFGLFFLVYFGKAIEAIIITRSTVQEIIYDGGLIRGKTFSGITFEVNRCSEIMRNEDFFAKKNIKFLFPQNKNLIIKCGSVEYYLSGNIEGIDKLLQLLTSPVR